MADLRPGWRRGTTCLVEYPADLTDGGAFIEEGAWGYDAEAYVNVANGEETLELHRFFAYDGIPADVLLEKAQVWCENALRRLARMADGDAESA